MTAQQAIQRLKDRNQAFVNKCGRTTDFSRETDDIIYALELALSVRREEDLLFDKLHLFGEIIGVGDMVRRISNLNYNALSLVALGGCNSYSETKKKYYEDTPWEVFCEYDVVRTETFDKSNPDKLITQLHQASNTYELKEAFRDAELTNNIRLLHDLEADHADRETLRIQKDLIAEYQRPTDNLL